MEKTLDAGDIASKLIVGSVCVIFGIGLARAGLKEFVVLLNHAVTALENK